MELRSSKRLQRASSSSGEVQVTPQHGMSGSGLHPNVLQHGSSMPAFDFLKAFSQGPHTVSESRGHTTDEQVAAAGSARNKGKATRTSREKAASGEARAMAAEGEKQIL